MLKLACPRGHKSNLLTSSALDPGAKIPETKVAAARIERIGKKVS